MSIRKRGERYEVRVYRGNGQYAYPGTFDTLTAAKQAEREHSLNVGGTNERVRDFAARWATDYPRPKYSTQVALSTAARRVAGDREAVRDGNRLFVLADLKLTHVTRPMARAYVQARPGYLHNALSAMFTDAVNDGLVAANPFLRLGVTRSRGRKEIKTLTESEVALLAEVALEQRGPAMYAAVMLAAYTGIRPGELVALRWGDVDLDRAEVRIERRHYLGSVDTPKNGRARTVILPPPALEALRRLPRTIGEEAVLTTVTGRPFRRNRLTYYFDPIRAAFEARLPESRRAELEAARGKPHLDLYELRHFCATMLLERGMLERDVAEHLGHSDGGTLVRKTYGHPDQAAARDRLRAAFDNVTELRGAHASSPIRRGAKPANDHARLRPCAPFGQR